MRTSRLAAAAALSCTAALALSGCSLLGANEPERDEEGEITEASDADAFSVRVGDCIEPVDWDAEGFSELPVIPCVEEHESEIYASMLMDDGDFPGASAVEDAAITFCDAEFATFVGVPWDQSELNYSYLGPSQETWEQADDREILCLILDPAGLVTGTLEGSAR